MVTTWGPPADVTARDPVPVDTFPVAKFTVNGPMLSVGAGPPDPNLRSTRNDHGEEAVENESASWRANTFQ